MDSVDKMTMTHVFESVEESFQLSNFPGMIIMTNSLGNDAQL